jgi:hypothetical protein
MNEREGLSPWALEETKFREICEVKICQVVTWFNVPFTCVLSAALCWKICTYTAYIHSLFFLNIISCTCILVYLTAQFPSPSTLIEKKIKFSSYVRKFRMEQLKSHICERAS